MELLCALLAGFFLWLLVYDWRRKWIGRLPSLAGELLCRAESTQPRKARRWFSIYLLICLLGKVCGVLSGRHFDLGGQCTFAVMFAMVLGLGIPLTRNIALEVRENGVLLGKMGAYLFAGRRCFVPWNQIAACYWVPRSFGTVARFDDTCNRLTIGEDAISPEQKGRVTFAIGRFVPVYDYDGAPLAKPDESQGKPRWISWRELDGPPMRPLQFDLQTMLLFTVVVACFAGMVSLRYRDPEFQAVMKLREFGPGIDYWGGDHVHRLDFSSCSNKPTDDDMVCLEPLAELATLDLSGSPITDAGLKHLKGLKKLRIVELANTGVTEAGMADLRRSLPDANVGQSPWIPPNATPPAPTPPKAKRGP